MGKNKTIYVGSLITIVISSGLGLFASNVEDLSTCTCYPFGVSPRKRSKQAMFIKQAKENTRKYLESIAQELENMEKNLGILTTTQEIEGALRTLERINEELAMLGFRGSTYEQLREMIEKSFIDSRFKPLHITPTNLYALLGLTTDSSYERVVDAIKRFDSGLSEEVNNLMKRQLTFIFSNEIAKENYDLFLLGKNTVANTRLQSDQARELKRLSDKKMSLKQVVQQPGKKD